MSPWFGKKEPETGPSKWPSQPQRGRPGEAIKISSLLSPGTVMLAAKEQDKQALLNALIARLCKEKGLSDPEVLLGRVLEREQGISTTLDSGLSLPHARIDNLPGIVAALAVSPHGVHDAKQQDLVIRVMFLFFSPNKPEFFPQHLQLLRGVSALLQPALIDKLCKQPSEAAVLELLRGQEA